MAGARRIDVELRIGEKGMSDIKRLGLGCMGMNLSNKDKSIETIHYALEQGITLLNTGEFYGGGESEMVLREALAGFH